LRHNGIGIQRSQCMHIRVLRGLKFFVRSRLASARRPSQPQKEKVAI